MRKEVLLGAALATGAVLLVPGLALAMSRAGRPLVKAAMKTGAVAYPEFRRAGAEVYEQMEDIAAEMRAEMQTAEAEADAAEAAGAMEKGGDGPSAGEAERG